MNASPHTSTEPGRKRSVNNTSSRRVGYKSLWYNHWTLTNGTFISTVPSDVYYVLNKTRLLIYHYTSIYKLWVIFCNWFILQLPTTLVSTNLFSLKVFQPILFFYPTSLTPLLNKSWQQVKNSWPKWELHQETSKEVGPRRTLNGTQKTRYREKPRHFPLSSFPNRRLLRSQLTVINFLFGNPPKKRPVHMADGFSRSLFTSPSICYVSLRLNISSHILLQLILPGGSHVYYLIGFIQSMSPFTSILHLLLDIIR